MGATPISSLIERRVQFMSRREDLKEWKRSRRAEIAMDVVSSVVLAFICISIFSYFLPGMTKIGVGCALWAC